MILILFGLPGAGKNYIGEILASRFGFYFYDADKDLTPAIKEAIKADRKLTDKEFKKYFIKVRSKLGRIAKKHDRVAMAQAFIREKDREPFIKHFSNIKFVYIHTPNKIANRRLDTRKHIVKKHHVMEIRKYYDKPNSKYSLRIKNDGNKLDLTKKLKNLLSRV